MSESHKINPKPEKTVSPQNAGSAGLGLEQSASEIAGATNPGIVVQRAAQQPSALSPSQVIYLQRTIGNNAVADLLGKQQPAPGPSLLLQPKLMVGPAKDHYEEEADRVAAKVLSQPQVSSPAPSSKVNRKEEDEAMQRVPLAKSITSLSSTASSAAKSPTTTLHRKTDQPQDTAAGFALDREQENKIRSSTGGNPLPDATRTFMESRFGTDFSGVRIHTGSESNQLNRKIDARAFTHRNHIYLGANGSVNDKRLLAHELTHVVQQGAAGNMPAGVTVQRAPKLGVIQRKGLGSWIKSKFSKKKATPTTPTPTPSVTDTKDTNKSSGSDGQELADSVEYERRLGRYTYNHAKSESSTKGMLNKMISVTIGDLNKIDTEDGKQRDAVTNTFGSDNSTSAGQVGKKFEPVLEVLKQGNLREQLTALMNAMFGPFKEYLRTALKKGRWAELEAKGLDAKKLKRRKRQMIFTPGARDPYRNPYLKYDRKNKSSYQDFGDKMRTEVKGQSDRTVDELDQGPNPVGLSDREKALQFPGKQNNEISGERLKWVEGATNWQINENNPWVKEAKNSLKMPVVAGPSGTMTRMLQLWEWLNKPVPLADWRLAVLGWMLSSNDHTFHEMMIAATDYGLPYRPGRESYMDVAPLTVNELRSNVARDGLFPHELAFKRKFDSGGMKTIMEDDEIDNAEDDLEDKKSSEAGALSGPAAAAIKLYTSFGYLILNPVLRGGPQAEEMIKKAILEKDEMYQFQAGLKDGTLDIKQLIAEAREIIPMLESGLTMLPDWQGHVYRGSASNSKFAYMGKSFKFDKVGSASTDIQVAKDFADDFNTAKYKYILEMDVTAGKDLHTISEVANEDEVVLPPGSSFTITKRQKPTKTDPYYHIFMKQTGRGGAKLDLGERPTISNDVDDSSSYSESEDESEDEIVKDLVLLAYEQVGDSEVATTISQSMGYVVEDWGTVEDEDGWSEINHVTDAQTYFVKTDELKVFLDAVAGKKSTPVPVAKPQKKLKLYMNVVGDEGYMDFPVTNKSDIISYAPYDMEPGWSKVLFKGDEDDGALTYFGKTDEIKDFLGVVAPIEDEDSTSESGSESSSLSISGSSPVDKSAVTVETGLNPKNYPAGDHTITVNSFLKLPASEADDTPYHTAVELFPGEKLVVHVTDEMTKANGRGRIVFFSHTYFVPLRMLFGDEHSEDESEGFDDEESFLVSESGEHIPMGESDTTSQSSAKGVIKEFILPDKGPHMGTLNDKGGSAGTIRPPAKIGATGNTKTAAGDVMAEFVYEGNTYWCWLSWWSMYFGEEYPKAGA
ncbi:MAG: DUF4157 domain-containing protein [Caldilineaceae bacterium]|nr:DUF4157 domain-containing protein [Caldilineaceae bacterium]